MRGLLTFLIIFFIWSTMCFGIEKPRNIFFYRKDLQRHLHEGGKVFDWMVSHGYAVKINRSKASINETVDLKSFESKLEKEYPQDVGRFIDHVQSSFYQAYLREKFNVAIQDLTFKKNYKMRLEFILLLSGEISSLEIIPLQENIPKDFLSQVDASIRKLSPLKPLPISISRYHQGVISKDLMGRTFLNGAEIYDWLSENKFIDNVSQNMLNPLTHEQKIRLAKVYPKEQKLIIDLFENINKKEHRFKVELVFQTRGWLSSFLNL